LLPGLIVRTNFNIGPTSDKITPFEPVGNLYKTCEILFIIGHFRIQLSVTWH